MMMQLRLLWVLVFFVQVGALTAMSWAVPSWMMNDSGGPVIAVTVHDTTPIFASASASQSAGCFTRQYAPALVWTTTCERVAAGNVSQITATSTDYDWVALTNLARRPCNLIFIPKTNDIHVFDAPSEQARSVILSADMPLWLVDNPQDGFVRLSTPQNGWRYLVPDTCVPMQWLDRKAFEERLSSLNISVMVPTSGNMSLDASAREALQNEFRVSLPFAAKHSFDVSTATLDDVLLDGYLAHNGAVVAAADPDILFIADASVPMQKPVSALTSAMLKNKHVRVYSIDTPILRKVLGAVVKATGGAFVPSSGASLFDGVKAVLGIEQQRIRSFYRAAESTIRRGRTVPVSSVMLSELVALGFKALPCPPPFQYARVTDGNVAFLDEPHRLLEAVSMLNGEIVNLKSTKNVSDIIPLYAALANVFDLNLDAPVRAFLSVDRPESAVQARDFLVRNLRAIPCLPEWASDMLDNDWRADYDGIKSGVIDPLLRILSDYEDADALRIFINPVSIYTETKQQEGEDHE